MLKGKSLLIGAGISVVILIFFIVAMSAFDGQALSKTPDQSRGVVYRADIITFDDMDAFGKLKETKAIFLHDQHTDALEKKNKDCMTCHKVENGLMSPKFMHIKDVGRDELTKIYCDNCTKCHSETIAAGEKAGPVKCDGCHRQRPLIKSSLVEMGFDKSLHYRHLKAQSNNCGRCHHEYDEKTRKLFYAKGKESTCRYCHQKKTQLEEAVTVVSMRLASHYACIDCHQKTLAKQMHAGPVRCAGCHDAAEQAAIVKILHVPRLKRGQPDNVLIKTGDPKDRTPQMMRVPFDHKAHEEYNDTCRVCHLVSLDSCAKCHPLTGSADKKVITLETVFHKPGHQSSCMGCHDAKQQDKNCAGCHAVMAEDVRKDSAACLRCHMVPPPERTGVLSTSKAAKMARLMPQLWKDTFGPIYPVSVPKTVVIKNLMDRYGPVEYPHRKVYEAIVKKLKSSKLAEYFHYYSETTLCLGCHHHSPADGNPPKCANCHGAPFDENHLDRPGIKASYHQQCMGCHQRMAVTKYLSCTSCHKERKKESQVSS